MPRLPKQQSSSRRFQLVSIFNSSANEEMPSTQHNNIIMESSSTESTFTFTPFNSRCPHHHHHQQKHRARHPLPRSTLNVFLCHLFLLIVLVILPNGTLSAKSTPDYYDCEDEGFFPHPKDCRKYFWCLDSGPANLGIVPHAFTCPSGLYFNTKTEACDYPNNVPCAQAGKNKTVLTRTRSNKKKLSLTSTSAPDVVDDEIVLTTVVPTTTEAPTTTVSTTTTKAPEKLLKEAGVTRHRRPQPVTTSTTVASLSAPQSTPLSSDDNLKQLLQFVQSLGGVEKIKSLVAEKEAREKGNQGNDVTVVGEPSSNSQTRSHIRVNTRQHQVFPTSTTSGNFFSPTYETPRRAEVSTSTTTTEAPLLPQNSNQVRHRRPQHHHHSSDNNGNLSDQPSAAITVNPFLSYADPSRGTTGTGPSTDSPAPGGHRDDTLNNILPHNHNSNHFNINDRLNNGNHLHHHNNNNNLSPAVVHADAAADQNSNNNLNNNNNNFNGNHGGNQNNNNFYSFSYNTPGSRVSITSQVSPGSPVAGRLINFNSPDSANTNNNGNFGYNDHQPHRQPAVNLPPPNPFNDPFFNYNTPSGGQRTPPADSPAPTVTEATTYAAFHDQPFVPIVNEQPRNPRGRESGYVRVRVNPASTGASNLRLPESPAPNGRRATRVRIANPGQINPGNLNHNLNPPSQPVVPAINLPQRGNRARQNVNRNNGNVINQPGQPGVLYDTDSSISSGDNLNHLSSSVTESPIIEFVTTRRPPRRRPPQREHLRSRQEENPVGALVNLPPPNLQVDPNPPPLLRHHHRPSQNPPRILPIAVPLVTLPPRPDAIYEPETRHINHHNHHHHHLNNQPNNGFSPSTGQPFGGGFTPASDLTPGTVRFSSLELPRSPPPPSPRPSFGSDDPYVTDFPFFDNVGNFPPETRLPQTFSPAVTTVVTIPPTTTTTTTTTTSAPLPSAYREPVSSTRRGRERSRQRSRVTPPLPADVAAVTPRPPRRTTSTTTTTITPPFVGSISSAIDEIGGPPVEMEGSGTVKCTRRGVFAHPASCGQFVVCAPASRGSTNYRSYLHHCPAEQVFVEEVGRCRPGNKERCEVFTR